jgi:hypothetical protein
VPARRRHLIWRNAQNPGLHVPVLPLAGKAVGSAASRFSNLQSPIPVECHLIHAFLRSGRIDRWPRKPDPPDSRAAAQAGLTRQRWSSFPQAVAELHPGTNKPDFVEVMPVSTSCIPAPSDIPRIHRAGPPETMTMRQNVKRNTTFPSIGRQPAPPFTRRQKP